MSSREQFEKEYKTTMEMTGIAPDDLFDTEADGSYKDGDVYIAFYWWQAARENMKKIKLPDFEWFHETDYGYDGVDEYAINRFDEDSCRSAVIEAIHDAGYEVE